MSAAAPNADATPAHDEYGRPTRFLSWWRLVAVTAYWLALSALWGSFSIILYTELVHRVLGSTHPLAGTAVAALTAIAIIIPILLQPTIGAISDHTRSRLGRRKPYILVGTLFDLVFLSFAAAAFMAPNYPAFLVAVLLLQCSSNFAQGPFQGYMPDLVPTPQVGVASGLMGLASLIGNLGGAGVAVLFVSILHWDPGVFITVGIVEVTTMLITMIWVPDSPGPPTDLTLPQRARAAWGLDILQQRSYVWLLVSRLFVLMGGATVANMGVLFLVNALGFETKDAESHILPVMLAIGLAAGAATLPAGMLSSRYGRKRVIYGGLVLGGVGAAGVALATDYWMVVAFVVPLGICMGSFQSVDWALMTDIIPKVESGRYMGMSNVVTAGSQGTAVVAAATIQLAVTLLVGSAVGYRAMMLLIVAEFLVGAWALTHVHEPMRRQAAARQATAGAVA
jgi:MFS family permease